MLATNTTPMLEVQGVTVVYSPEPLIIEQYVEQFSRLDKLSVSTATPNDIVIKQIRENTKRNHEWLHNLSEFRQVKTDKIALVGGGPSLADTIKELKEFDTIVACGSVHDYLMNNGVIPTYTVVCDPDAISATYLKNKSEQTKFLIATCCHKDVFDQLKENQIYLWHCYSDDNVEETKKITEEVRPPVEFHAIGGGCTVGLRAISIAIMFGYTNIHFFGFDSCIKNDKYYAYDLNSQKELEGIKGEKGNIFRIKPGFDQPGETEYTVVGYQLAQVQHFKDFYIAYKQFFTPTFHGEGLLKRTYELILEDIARESKIQ